MTNHVTTETADEVPAGLLRRLAAIVYDSMLLFGVLFGATAVLLPFTGGEALAPEQPLYLLYLLGVSFLYFGWCWTRGGQTLGMKAWRVKTQACGGGPVSWGMAGRRYMVALLGWLAAGTGFWWALVDRGHRTWHDRLSRTELVRVRPNQAAKTRPRGSA